MPKRMPNYTYVYYGATHTLSDRERQIVEEAKKILSQHTCKIFNEEIPCSKIPYNVVKVSRDGREVSFMWYDCFWDCEKPRLLYSIKVNMQDKTITITPPSRVPRSEKYPVDYLHGKEEFVEGMCVRVVNPYGNWQSLRWDNKTRRDVWKPLFMGDKSRIRKVVEELEKLVKELKNRFNV